MKIQCCNVGHQGLTEILTRRLCQNEFQRLSVFLSNLSARARSASRSYSYSRSRSYSDSEATGAECAGNAVMWAWICARNDRKDMKGQKGQIYSALSWNEINSVSTLWPLGLFWWTFWWRRPQRLQAWRCFVSAFSFAYSHPLVIQNCWQTWQVTILSRHTNCTMPGGVYWKVEDLMIFLLNFGCATRVRADLRYRVLSKLGAGAFSTVRTPRQKSVVCCVLCPIHRPGKGWEKSWFNLIWCDIMSCYIIYYMTYCWHQILEKASCALRRNQSQWPRIFRCGYVPMRKSLMAN